jgi:hypothetical protein
VKLHKAQASQEAKRDLQQQMEDLFAEGRSMKELVAEVKEQTTRSEVPESDVVSIVSFLSPTPVTFDLQQVHFVAVDVCDGAGGMEQERGTCW